MVGGGIGRIFVTVDGVKHGINFLFLYVSQGSKSGWSREVALEKKTSTIS